MRCHCLSFEVSGYSDEAVLKTKVKRTYEFDRVAANRYAFKVFVENGLVVGLEDKR